MDLGTRVKNLKIEGKRLVKKFVARTEIVDPFKVNFKELEFETTAYCNRKCTYCPVSMYPRNGDQDGRYMKEEVFSKLISDLVELNYQGLVSPHLYGEPLTDPRIVEWVKALRDALPKAQIKVVTNGDYLNKDIYQKLVSAGLSFFHLSKHGESLSKSCLDLLDSLSKEEKDRMFTLIDFYSDFKTDQTLLNTRAGEVKLKIKKKNPIMCSYVSYPVLDTFGNLILCCNDYHSEHKFGNIMDSSLKEIWFSKKNIETRKRIFKGHFDYKICQDCYM